MKYRVKKFLQRDKSYNYQIQKKFLYLFWCNMYYRYNQGPVEDGHFYYCYSTEQEALNLIEQFKKGEGFK